MRPRHLWSKKPDQRQAEQEKLALKAVSDTFKRIKQADFKTLKALLSMKTKDKPLF